MIFVTEPRNAPAHHRFLVVEILREGRMRLARCERREHADHIARAWREGIYTIAGEIRTWTCDDPSSFARVTSGTASTGRTLAEAIPQPRPS